MTATPPRLELEVAHATPVVAGGPLTLVLTMRLAAARGARMWDLPAPSLYAPTGLGVVLRRDGRETRVEPGAVIDEYQPMCDVATDRPRRMLCDVSALAPVKVGQMSMAVLATTPFGVAESNALALTVTPPSQAEAEVLALAGGDDFAAWADEDTASPLDDRPLAALSPLVLHALLRRWRRGPASVAASELDSLPATLAPERLALLAERARAAGDVAEAARLAAEVRALGVGLDWWMDDLERGHSWTGARLRG
jgi:hypothetical protein